MAPKQKFPTETETQQLEQEGFSNDQIADLFTLKALYDHGVYHEDDPERNRQMKIVLRNPLRSPDIGPLGERRSANLRLP